MKKLLVHLHIYYLNMWNKIQAYLDNITVPFDLYITMPKEAVGKRLNKKSILQKYPTTRIITVPNKGADVAPFIHVLKKVNLSDYSHIIKLHTKRDMDFKSQTNHYRIGGKLWREYLFSPLSSKKNFNKCIQHLNKDKNLGMIGNFRLIMNKNPGGWTDDMCKKYMKEMHLPFPKYRYIGGTMFMARAKIFKPLQKLNISINDFETLNGKHFWHLGCVFEYIFGLITIAQKYKIKDVFTPKVIQLLNKPKQIRMLWHTILHRTIFKGYNIATFFGIPVYIKRIKK